MSQTRVKHTKEERIKYWKDRMLQKTVSMSQQMLLDQKWILDNMKHVGLDQLDIMAVWDKLGKALWELGTVIVEAKTVEEATKIREEEKKKAEIAEASAKATIDSPKE